MQVQNKINKYWKHLNLEYFLILFRCVHANYMGRLKWQWVVC